MGDHLDFAAWDSYPIGFAEHFPFADPERQRWQDTSHPDIAPFHHDLYRGVGRGRFWVMEQQPEPSTGRRGTLPRRAAWSACGRSKRTRTAPSCQLLSLATGVLRQEQMHAGLNLPSSHELSQGGREAAAAADAVARRDWPVTAPAQVAIVYDYEAHWVTAIQPQGADFRYSELVFRWYEAIRRLALTSISCRRARRSRATVLCWFPACRCPVSAERAFGAATGIVAFGPRSGSEPPTSIPEELPPRAAEPPEYSRDRSLIVAAGRACRDFGSGLRPRRSVGGSRWRRTPKRLRPSRTARPPSSQRATTTTWLAGPTWARSTLMALLCRKAGLATIELPMEVRLRRRGDLTFAFNYGRTPWRAHFSDEPLLGELEVMPRNFTVWRR